jgi:hypothetical protein
MVLPCYLYSASAFLPDFLTIELASLGVEFLSSQPFVMKEFWRIVNTNLHCIFYTDFFPVIRRLMLALDRGDFGEEVVKDDVILGDDTPSAQVENLGHFTGVLGADSHEHSSP